MLSVELSWDGGDDLKLEQYLSLANRLRRLYAPYFVSNQYGRFAGHCPEELTLSRTVGGRTTTVRGGYATTEEFDAHVRAAAQDCEPHTVAVWRELLWPLLPYRVGTEKEQTDESTCRLRYEQILDDRMPVLAFVAVPDPRAISPGDWVRLTFVDEPGEDSVRWPYSPAFYGPAGLAPYTYDRFWADSPDPPAAGWMNTRWLCCNYALTAVGSSDSGFFMDAAGGARAHVRYHYFKMALVAHFHRASLLVFKRQLADAVEELQQGNGSGEAALDEFAERLQRIQLDLLAFRNMYWFTEVSNQLQGLELFDLLSKHLRTRELFQQVFEEAEKAAAIVSGSRDRQMNRRSARLAVLSAMFLLVAPAVTALFTTEEIKAEYRVVGAFLASLTGVLLGLAGTGVLTDVIDWVARNRWRKVVVGAVALVTLFTAGRLYFAGEKPPKDDPKPAGPNLILFNLPGDKPPAKP